MDIITHVLWGLIVFHKLDNYWIVVIMSIFPDVVSFAFPYIQVLYSKKVRKNFFSGLKKLWMKKGDMTADEMFGGMPKIVRQIYNITHSMPLIGSIFLIVYLISPQSSYYVLPWLLHVIIDIPSHSKDNFSTQFLYPFSKFSIDGFPSTRPLFQIINYGLIVLFGYIVFFI
jgi:hypothetical protein